MSNSAVFTDLQRVETAFRLSARSATFGRSVVDFERHIQIYTVQATYGLTDRLSLGVRIPYWNQRLTDLPPCFEQATPYNPLGLLVLESREGVEVSAYILRKLLAEGKGVPNASRMAF